MGNILTHHGVKGQKWGVRKDGGHEGEQATTKKIAKLDKKFEKDAKNPYTYIAVHNHAAKELNTHELHRINNKSQYKNVDLTKNPELKAKYEHEVQATYVKHLRAGVEKLGTNASGTKKYTIETNPNGHWNVASSDVAHSDSSYKVPLKRGPKGHVLSVGDPEDSMQQGADLVNNILSHHGVLGMKWGHRRGSSESSSSESKSSVPTHASNDHVQAESHKSTLNKHGLKALSNDDLKQLNERMQLEQTYRNLNGQKPTKFETGHKQVKKILAVGKTLNDINAIATSPVGKAARAAYKTQSTGKTAYKVYKVTKSDE